MTIDKLLLHYNVINPRVLKEIRHAVDKHGLQENISYEKQLAVILEEIGEVAKALLERDYKGLRVEIAQSIAMLVKLDWLVQEREEKDE